MHKITPDHAPHETLVRDVSAWLDEQGFATYSAAYHDHNVMGMAEEDEDRFRHIYIPAALIVRHRPDRLAFHRERDCAFLWEAKTKGKKPPRNETVFIDLVTIIANAQVNTGARVLYVHRNQHSGHEVGFWMHDMPPVSSVGIPACKWEGMAIDDWYHWAASKLFPHAPISRAGTRGTNDPFVTMEHEAICALPHWKTAILEEMDAEQTWVAGIARQADAPEVWVQEHVGQSRLFAP